MQVIGRLRPTPPHAESPEARDQRLLHGIRAGAPGALEEAFHAFYDALYRYAYGIVRSREVAEELIQDVFLRVWERRLELHGGGRLGPYLFAALRNAAFSWLRRARIERALHGRVASAQESGDVGRRRPVGAAPAGAVPGMSDAAYENADAERRQAARELADELHRAVERLPARAREAISLRWQRQLKNSEIAEVMGCSVKAVEFSIARALDALRGLVAPP